MREFDLVLHGATGFTGQLAAKELSLYAPPALRWAISGRSEHKLQELGEKHAVPYLVADGLDAPAVQRVADSAGTVISCAGPFQEFGTPLVRACAHAGTHYADLSGELGWIWQLIQELHPVAQERGACIIPASGFDSVPSDLGVYTLAETIRQSGDAIGDITGFYRLKGGLNGGTLASGVSQSRHYSPEDLQHPFLLDPDPTQSWDNRLMPPEREKVFEVRGLRSFAAPFLMAPVNERVVRRTAALLSGTSNDYGNDFCYSEFHRSSDKAKAKQISAALTMTNWALNKPVLTKLIERFGPKPGEGPSEQVRTTGLVELTLLAGDIDNPGHRLDWFFPGDPGNTVTVRCLVQVGLSLAAGESRATGLQTPATALGARLTERLFERDALLNSA